MIARPITKKELSVVVIMLLGMTIIDGDVDDSMLAGC